MNDIMEYLQSENNHKIQKSNYEDDMVFWIKEYKIYIYILLDSTPKSLFLMNRFIEVHSADRVLFMGNLCEEEVLKVYLCGANAYISMNTPLSEFEIVLDYIKKNNHYLSLDYAIPMASFILKRSAQELKVKEIEENVRLTLITNQAQEVLTSRECEILQCILDGLNNKDMGKELFIAESTIKKHIHKVFGKLNVRDRISCIFEVKKRGWIERDTISKIKDQG